jgi:vacuolar iron transporter family protein
MSDKSNDVDSQQDKYAHFKGKDAIGHVAEAQAEGRIAATEIHGLEVPGHLSALSDAARDMAVVLVLIWIIGVKFNLPQLPLILSIFAIGWTIWKAGRSAWLAWFRLERMHRVLYQEKWEIEHYEQQEREELKVLYAAKGFEGKLLDDVVDVLMADGDRLLKVMVEEELGLSLEAHDHPLKQGLGALFGAISAAVFCLLSFLAYPNYGMPIGSALVLIVTSILTARYAQNRNIPAVVWNLGIAVLACGFVLYLFEYFFSKG